LRQKKKLCTTIHFGKRFTIDRIMFNFNRGKNKPMEKEKGLILSLLPLRDVVIFPHMIIPLFVGREKSINALESAMKEENDIFLSTQKDAQKDDPDESDIYEFGTLGSIIQLLRLPDGTVKVLVEGKRRGVIKEYLPNPDSFLVRIEQLGDC